MCHAVGGEVDKVDLLVHTLCSPRKITRYYLVHHEQVYCIVFWRETRRALRDGWRRKYSLP